MTPHLYALAAAAVLVVVAYVAVRVWDALARRRVLGAAPPRPRSEPYILYFSGQDCTICRTHQEPALRRLDGVRVEKVDALKEEDLARRYQVYTLPTTVVLSADGIPVHVNYGYTTARRLREQLQGVGQEAVPQAV